MKKQQCLTQQLPHNSEDVICRTEKVPAPLIRHNLFFSGVPAVVDFAAMRDTVKRLGGDPESINPICPADLVIDHSVQVDVARR